MQERIINNTRHFYNLLLILKDRLCNKWEQSCLVEGHGLDYIFITKTSDKSELSTSAFQAGN